MTQSDGHTGCEALRGPFSRCRPHPQDPLIRGPGPASSYLLFPSDASVLVLLTGAPRGLGHGCCWGHHAQDSLCLLLLRQVLFENQ